MRSGGSLGLEGNGNTTTKTVLQSVMNLKSLLQEVLR